MLKVLKNELVVLCKEMLPAIYRYGIVAVLYYVIVYRPLETVAGVF